MDPTWRSSSWIGSEKNRPTDPGPKGEKDEMYIYICINIYFFYVYIYIFISIYTYISIIPLNRVFLLLGRICENLMIDFFGEFIFSAFEADFVWDQIPTDPV